MRAVSEARAERQASRTLHEPTGAGHPPPCFPDFNPDASSAMPRQDPPDGQVGRRAPWTRCGMKPGHFTDLAAIGENLDMADGQLMPGGFRGYGAGLAEADLPMESHLPTASRLKVGSNLRRVLGEDSLMGFMVLALPSSPSEKSKQPHFTRTAARALAPTARLRAPLPSRLGSCPFQDLTNTTLPTLYGT